MLLLVGACSGSDHADLFGTGSGGAQRDAQASGTGGALGGAVIDRTAAGGTNSGAADGSFGAGGAAGSGASAGAGSSGGSAGMSDNAGAGGAPPTGSAGAGPITTDGAVGGPGEGGAGPAPPSGAPDAGSRDAGNSRTCVGNDDCASSEYCRRTGCAAATPGRCTVRPASCTNSENPVCGCNGVTYFNTCLAASHQQNVAGTGECTASTALECERANDPACTAVSGVCGFLLEDERPCLAATLGAVRGHCWVLPTVCSENDVHYDSCIRGGSRCVHTCQAIKEETPYFRNTVCD